MDFSKFVSLLDRKSLAFTRVDRLSDQFEGSYSKQNVDARSRSIAYNSNYEANFESRSDIFKKLFNRVDRISDPFEGSYSKQHVEPMSRSVACNSNNDINFESMSDIFKKLREYIYVNCWHVNDYESVAMWSLYSKSNEGVAIQSRSKKLYDVFLNEHVVLDKVRYIDYNQDFMSEINPLCAFFYKRKSYAHENELRAAFSRIPKESEGYINLADTNEILEECIDLSIKLDNYVEYIPVDLTYLIEKIYVSQTAEDWFVELVRSIVGKYGLKEDLVIRSDLAIDPTF